MKVSMTEKQNKLLAALNKVMRLGEKELDRFYSCNPPEHLRPETLEAMRELIEGS